MGRTMWEADTKSSSCRLGYLTRFLQIPCGELVFEAFGVVRARCFGEWHQGEGVRAGPLDPLFRLRGFFNKPTRASAADQGVRPTCRLQGSVMTVRKLNKSCHPPAST